MHSHLNLTLLHLTMINALGGPILTFNTAIRLSVYQCHISRFSGPFLFNTYGQIKIFKSYFNRALNEVFFIGKSPLQNDKCTKNNNNFTFCDDLKNITINSHCYVFFGCCRFEKVSCAIFSDQESYSTVKIKGCIIIGENVNNRGLVYLPDNEQIIIEDSYFKVNPTNSQSSNDLLKGLFIFSDSSQQSNLILSKMSSNAKFQSFLKDDNLNLLSYFSLTRTFFGFDDFHCTVHSRDTISSTALFHDIRFINMTDIDLPNCIWGCCLGLKTEFMIRITFSTFYNNTGKNLIWIWNIPDEQYQKFERNYFINNDVDSIFYIENDMYISNCFFTNADFWNTSLFRRYNKARYITTSIRTIRTFNPIIFDTSRLEGSNCIISDPSQTPIPKPSPYATPTPVATPKSQSYVPDPTSTPFPTLTRTPWPTESPMPTHTPTATPHYMPIFGISFAVVFAICVIIFLIVFFCRQYHHQSSEETVGDNLAINLSGDDERSYSSETDPLNLNTSSDDSFII